MTITYHVNEPLSEEEFVSVLRRSTLAERRPVNDPACIAGMLEHADLTVVAKKNGEVIGVARSVTDFSYCCYLSDLAVDRRYQKHGIGRELIRRTRRRLESTCVLILLSAPAAVDYYPKLGFEHHPQAWVLMPGDEIM